MLLDTSRYEKRIEILLLLTCLQVFLGRYNPQLSRNIGHVETRQQVPS